MQKFKEFLVENQGANKHLEHIEDEILNDGFDGLRKSITYLLTIQKALEGNATKKLTITTKWDGAPAIVAGIDPISKNFFVATKHGAFGKTPKLNFTDSDIDENHPAQGLNVKMKSALKYLSKIGMDGVYQGDLLYSEQGDKKIENIDDESMVTFTPNTLTYAIPINSELGKKVNASKIGIVWHTKYTGDGPVNEMSAGYEINLNNFGQSSDVWYRDANYEIMDGVINFTKDERNKFSTLMSGAGKLFRSLNKKTLNDISSTDDLNIQIKAYTNSKVREGQIIGNPRAHVVGLIAYLRKKLNAQVEKLKTEKARKAKQEKHEEFISFFVDNKVELRKIFEMQNILIAAKTMLLKKLQEISQQAKTFITTPDGFKVTNPEGFVAVTAEGGAIKLVDRLEFSRQNFTMTKSFSKK